MLAVLISEQKGRGCHKTGARSNTMACSGEIGRSDEIVVISDSVDVRVLVAGRNRSESMPSLTTLKERSKDLSVLGTRCLALRSNFRQPVWMPEFLRGFAATTLPMGCLAG